MRKQYKYRLIDRKTMQAKSALSSSHKSYKAAYEAFKTNKDLMKFASIYDCTFEIVEV